MHRISTASALRGRSEATLDEMTRTVLSRVMGCLGDVTTGEMPMRCSQLPLGRMITGAG